MKTNPKVILVVYYVFATVIFADMIDKWVDGEVYNLLAGLILAFILHSLWKIAFKKEKINL